MQLNIYGSNFKDMYAYIKWMPLSLSELTPIIYSMLLTHLGS